MQKYYVIYTDVGIEGNVDNPVNGGPKFSYHV